jgi:peroxiredoxin
MTPRRLRGRASFDALLVGLLLLPVCVGLAGCPSNDTPGESEQSTRPAPDFTLEQLGGAPVRLADLRGKTVVLDFWATWCPPCEFQVPELNRFFDAHRSDGDVVVYGVSVDQEGPEVVQAWTVEKDVRYPILLGGEKLARQLGAVGFPTLYVVGPDGQVRETHMGLIQAEELEQALAQQRKPASSS